ncbi:MAG: AI-2E family transporter [Acidobacteriaceae bacterium]
MRPRMEIQDPLQDALTNRSLRGDILFAFALGIGAYLVWVLRDVFVLLYVSALFAVVLTPVVHGVMRLRIGHWGPSRGMAIFLIVLGLALGIGTFLLFTLPPLVRDVNNFVRELPSRSQSLTARLQSVPLLDKVDMAAVTAKLKSEAAQYAGQFLYSLGNWAGKLFDILTGIVLTIYFMAEGEHVYQWALSLVPAARRGRLDQTLQRASVRMERWLLGQLALMLILGVASGVVFGLLHVRYYFVLAVVMGVSNIVPVIGALVSVSLAMLAAAVDSWTKVLGVAIFQLVYSQIESAYLTPRIMRTRVDLAGIAIVIALLLGLGLAGVVGALVSVPTAVLVAVLVDEYLIQPETAQTPTE